jgi:hypothetical protein
MGIGRLGGGSIAGDVGGGLFGGRGGRRLGRGFGPDNLPKGGVNLSSCRMANHAIPRLVLLVVGIGVGEGGTVGGRVGGAMPDDLPEGAVNLCSCRMAKHAFARLMRIGGGGSIGGGVGGGLFRGGGVRRGAVPDDLPKGAVHLCSYRMTKHAVARLMLGGSGGSIGGEVFGGLFGGGSGLVLRAHPCDLPKGGVNRCSCRLTNNASARLMLEGGGDGNMLGFGGSMLGNGGGVRVGLFGGGEGDGGDGLGGGTVLCGQPDGVPKGVINLTSYGRPDHALARLGLRLERSRHRV